MLKNLTRFGVKHLSHLVMHMSHMIHMSHVVSDAYVAYANGSRSVGKEEHDRECKPGVPPTRPDLTNSFASV